MLGDHATQRLAAERQLALSVNVAIVGWKREQRSGEAVVRFRKLETTEADNDRPKNAPARGHRPEAWMIALDDRGRTAGLYHGRLADA